MMLRVLEFLAIVFTAIILVPSGAHFFELPNKINLVQDQYFIVQNIYRGWALFGAVFFPALVFTALLGFLSRDIMESRLAFFACLCIAASLGVFFGFVYPGNVATENWTTIPDNWQTLRQHWEYGHALSAILSFIAFCALVLGVVSRR